MPNFLTEALQGAKSQFASNATVLPLLEEWERRLSEINSGSSPKDLAALNETAKNCIRTIQGLIPLGGYDLTPLCNLQAAQPSE